MPTGYRRPKRVTKVTRSFNWAPNILFDALNKELAYAIKAKSFATHPLWEEDQKTRMKACENNLELFGRVYCPHWMEDETPEFHLELYSLAEEAKKRPGSGCVIAAPRGHAKSTIMSFLFPLHELLYKRKKYIMVISNTYEMSQSMIAALRNELETNARIRADFGNLIGNKWTGGQILTSTGIRVIAKGTNSQIRGSKSGSRRPDLLIADDIENDDHVTTEEQRDKTWNWWTKVVLPAVDPKRGTIIFVGTVIHFDSLLAKLLSPDNATSFIKKKYQTPKEDGTPLWPARYPLEKLEQIKADIKSLAYNSEYMNNPIDESTQIFQPKWWKWYTREDVWFDKDRWCWVFKGEPMEIFQGIDPAIGTKQYADWFAHVTVGITPSKKVIILWVIKDHIDFPSQVRLVTEQYNNWRPKRIGIEDAVFQRALRQQLLDNGKIPEQALIGLGESPIFEDHPHIEADIQRLTKGLRRLASSKHLRIVSRSILVEQGQVYLRLASTPQEVREGRLLDQLGLPELRIHKDFYEFFEEAVQFPRAAHDDILDAWDDALQVAGGMARWGTSWIAGEEAYGV